MDQLDRKALELIVDALFQYKEHGLVKPEDEEKFQETMTTVIQAILHPAPKVSYRRKD
jgi:hypothetical protein